MDELGEAGIARGRLAISLQSEPLELLSQVCGGFGGAGSPGSRGFPWRQGWRSATWLGDAKKCEAEPERTAAEFDAGIMGSCWRRRGKMRGLFLVRFPFSHKAPWPPPKGRVCLFLAYYGPSGERRSQAAFCRVLGITGISCLTLCHSSFIGKGFIHPEHN